MGLAGTATPPCLPAARPGNPSTSPGGQVAPLAEAGAEARQLEGLEGLQCLQLLQLVLLLLSSCRRRSCGLHVQVLANLLLVAEEERH